MIVYQISAKNTVHTPYTCMVLANPIHLHSPLVTGWAYLVPDPVLLADIAAFLCSVADLSSQAIPLDKELLQLAVKLLQYPAMAQIMPAKHSIPLLLAATQEKGLEPSSQLLSNLPLFTKCVTLGPQQLSDLLLCVSTMQQGTNIPLELWEAVAVQLHALLPSISSSQLVRSATALADLKRSQQLPPSFFLPAAKQRDPPPHIAALASSISDAVRSASWGDSATLLEAAADLELCAIVPGLHASLSSLITTRATDQQAGAKTDQKNSSTAIDAVSFERIESALQRAGGANRLHALMGLNTNVPLSKPAAAKTTVAAPTAAPAGSANQVIAAELQAFQPAWESDASSTHVMGEQEAKEKLSNFKNNFEPYTTTAKSELAVQLLVSAAHHNLTPLPQQQLEHLWSAAAPVVPTLPASRIVVLMWALSRLHVVGVEQLVQLQATCIMS